MMRILHGSDWHGHIPKLLGNFDITISSGDFFPNSKYFTTDRPKEIDLQYQWLKSKIPILKEYLWGRPFLFIMGNHDFCSPDRMEEILIKGGINAINLTDKLITYEGVNFYGFPYIPYYHGFWNYECTPIEMYEHIKKMVNTLNTSYVDVLVTHSPPYKCLDLTHGNVEMGSTAIANALDYQLNEGMLPQALLCGHCHEASGITMRNGMLVSNAALRQHIISI